MGIEAELEVTPSAGLVRILQKPHSSSNRDIFSVLVLSLVQFAKCNKMLDIFSSLLEHEVCEAPDRFPALPQVGLFPSQINI